MRRLVIVGAGLAGHRAALEARRWDPNLEIIVVGAEAHPPYQRPPLSKGLLLGSVRPERLRLRSQPDAYEHRPNVRAVGLDLAERAVETSGGPLSFDGLIVATGADPVLPPLFAHPATRTLRTVDDALALRARITPGHRVVAIGAGFIGLELASSLLALGAAVTVVEAEERVLPRAVGPGAAAIVASWHEHHGVTLRTTASVAAMAPGGPVLADGTELPADTVLVGIGVRPAVGWVANALPSDPRLGLLADEYGTVVDGVAAAGDAATWRHPAWSAPVRSEHFETAATQGVLAARNLLCAPREAWRDVPFGWSDQHGHLIQVLGVPGADAEEERRNEHTWAYYRNGRLEGFVLLDAAEDLVDRRDELARSLGLSE